MGAHAPDPASPTGAGEDSRLPETVLTELRTRLSVAVTRVCPPWLASQAEDIVQCALIRIASILERGEGEVPLRSSYIWKAAYTATVDEIRRRRRRREVSLEAEVIERRSPDPDPERTLGASEIGDGLRDCLARLTDGRRRAVTLHLQGHSVPEASRILRWTLKRVENLVYRGLADLRRCLAGKGLTP